MSLASFRKLTAKENKMILPDVALSSERADRGERGDLLLLLLLLLSLLCLLIGTRENLFLSGEFSSNIDS